MADVFISYKREDKKLVRWIAEELKKHGVSSWYDHQLEGGDAWWKRITGEIEISACVIAIWSDHSIDKDLHFISTYMRNEHALARSKLVPLQLCDRIPSEFQDVQALDFNFWDCNPDAECWIDFLAQIRENVSARPLTWQKIQQMSNSAQAALLHQFYSEKQDFTSLESKFRATAHSLKRKLAAEVEKLSRIEAKYEEIRLKHNSLVTKYNELYGAGRRAGQGDLELSNKRLRQALSRIEELERSIGQATSADPDPRVGRGFLRVQPRLRYNGLDISWRVAFPVRWTPYPSPHVGRTARSASISASAIGYRWRQLLVN